MCLRRCIYFQSLPIILTVSHTFFVRIRLDTWWYTEQTWCITSAYPCINQISNFRCISYYCTDIAADGQLVLVVSLYTRVTDVQSKSDYTIGNSINFGRFFSHANMISMHRCENALQVYHIGAADMSVIKNAIKNGCTRIRSMADAATFIYFTPMANHFRNAI